MKKNNEKIMNESIKKYVEDVDKIVENFRRGLETKIVYINGKKFYLNEEELEVVDMFFGYHTVEKDEKAGEILIYKNL